VVNRPIRQPYYITYLLHAYCLFGQYVRANNLFHCFVRREDTETLDAMADHSLYPGMDYQQHRKVSAVQTSGNARECGLVHVLHTRKQARGDGSSIAHTMVR
jgi:hypothetical protein